MCDLRFANCDLRIANWKSDPQIETRRVEIPYTKCRDLQTYAYHPIP